MVITRFGIQLIKLKREYLELVREKRNSPFIRDFMEYREYITEGMQKHWFQSLHPVHDFYFVIKYKGDLVGLIHTSSIDWQAKTGHAGLFVWKPSLLGTYVPVMASLSMVDFFFSYTSLEKIYAKVMKQNKVAIEYNNKLGFELIKGQQEKNFQEYILDRKDYYSKTDKLYALAQKVENAAYHIEMSQILFKELKAAGAINEEAWANQPIMPSVVE